MIEENENYKVHPSLSEREEAAWQLYCSEASRACASVQFDFWSELDENYQKIWLERIDKQKSAL